METVECGPKTPLIKLKIKW